MPLHTKQPEPRRLYLQVADQIRNVIEQGRFEPGTRLPPERELAVQLGVSRPSLREALLALEIEGRVEIRMGSGVYVCAAPPMNGATPEPLSMGDSPSELMHARSLLETSIVTLAVARATPQGIERLKACLDAMRADVERGQPPVEADRRFHITLAEMAGNSVLVRLVGELFDGRHGLIMAKATGRMETMATWDAALREHEAIYQALVARDPQDAVAAMHWHLNASRERWVGEGASC